MQLSFAVLLVLVAVAVAKDFSGGFNSKPTSPDCPVPGSPALAYVADPNDCTKYSICSDKISVKVDCPFGQCFNGAVCNTDCVDCTPGEPPSLLPTLPDNEAVELDFPCGPAAMGACTPSHDLLALKILSLYKTPKHPLLESPNYIGVSVVEWASAHQLGAHGAKARTAEPRHPGFNPRPCPFLFG
ncbi:secreted salivary gland peptide, putative [Ixodes scapularis]|uniref:Secreted salivary gland peptide, putative n=1 Tax=Ixodes scapularis TaxID=6945 RepID=B7PSJ5_IXOSC|nr:secreted salivary gland peptide, putative [Ixodes scapularis]|eukprot:XP_002402674.1 secreted salivary gland peptide, putative [Ixodes scapularis]